MKNYTLRCLAFLLVFMLLLSGCGKAGEKEGSTGNKNDAVLSLEMRETTSFNPFTVTNHSVRDALSLCYEPLFIIDEKMELEGVLARNIQIADDSLSAVVMLKDSILWHNGVSLTSTDVMHSINLLKENPSWQYSDCVKYIERVEPIAPLSFRIILSRPYSQIGYSLYFPIVSSQNDDIDAQLLGTGPYELENYRPSALLELKAFDKWHGGKANCEKIEINIIRGNEAAATAFNTGIISAITGESFDLNNFTPKSSARVTSFPSNEYEFLAFNHRRSQFSSASVRCAISSAIDRKSLVEECYGGNGYIANAPIHPNAQDLTESSVLTQYSLSNAEELFFLEGYHMNERTHLIENEKGEKLFFNILVNSENLNRLKSAKEIQSQLLLAGIEVSITELPFEEYEKRIREGSYDTYLGGTKLLNPYDYEALFSKEGALNNFGYSDDYMDLAMSALSSSPGKDALSNAVFNFDEVFSREQPVCGLLFCADALITSSNVMGKLLPAMNFPYRNIANWSIK